MAKLNNSFLGKIIKTAKKIAGWLFRWFIIIFGSFLFKVINLVTCILVIKSGLTNSFRNIYLSGLGIIISEYLFMATISFAIGTQTMANLCELPDNLVSPSALAAKAGGLVATVFSAVVVSQKDTFLTTENNAHTANVSNQILRETGNPTLTSSQVVDIMKTPSHLDLISKALISKLNNVYLNLRN